MSSVKIELKMAKLGAVTAAVERRVDRALATVALLVEGGAKEQAPVDTGALKNSIEARRVKSLQHEVSVGVEYGAYVELGTVRSAAQPYLTPAVERQREVFEQVVGAAMAEALEEEGI